VFNGKTVKVTMKLVVDLYAFWKIFTTEEAQYGWLKGKLFCQYCNQKCDCSVTGVQGIYYCIYILILMSTNFLEKGKEDKEDDEKDNKGIKLIYYYYYFYFYFY
jgi:hypothetical protein